ncbi:hypothetical protein SAY86_003760 [Trapa natans]|uniref:Uncharacterized protein n=1 Tax=Trapa natans TaxID=22666 RepID=A0AAN7RPL8_TRANT|nr:hypothetical protein SAY86_003760 [Trapa natans]
MMWRSVLCSPPLMELSEKMLKLCFYGASAAFCSIVYTTIAAFFALVGGTLGAMVGSLIGLKAERRFLQRAALGTIAGVFFSVELFKISVGFFLPEGNRFCLFGPMVSDLSYLLDEKEPVDILTLSLLTVRLCIGSCRPKAGPRMARPCSHCICGCFGRACTRTERFK